MKVTKYKDQKDGVRRINAYYKHKELVGECKMISLDGIRRDEPEYHKAFRSEFYGIDTYRSDEEEMEDFISYLIDEVEIEKGDNGFDMPLPDSTREYILIFNDMIWLYLYFSDEYLGMGESNQFVHIDSIMIPEGTPVEEVREVKDWLVKGGFKLLR